jgi:hypothetical protein
MIVISIWRLGDNGVCEAASRSGAPVSEGHPTVSPIEPAPDARPTPKPAWRQRRAGCARRRVHRPTRSTKASIAPGTRDSRRLTAGATRPRHFLDRQRDRLRMLMPHVTLRSTQGRHGGSHGRKVKALREASNSHFAAGGSDDLRRVSLREATRQAMSANLGPAVGHCRACPRATEHARQGWPEGRFAPRNDKRVDRPSAAS